VSTGEFKSKFRGNYIDSCVDGLHVMTLKNHGDETYEITWPTMVARGILWGSARIEHGSNLVVYCAKTGYKSQISFDKSDHKMDGYIYKGQKEKVFHIKGNLQDKIYVTDERSGEKKVFIDCEHVKREKYIVPEITKQSENESRRVWHNVTYSLKKHDYDRAAKCKTEIEEFQRKLAKQRKENNDQWKPRIFSDTKQKTANNVPIFTWDQEGYEQQVVNGANAGTSSSSGNEGTGEIEQGVNDLDLD